MTTATYPPSLLDLEQPAATPEVETVRRMFLENPGAPDNMTLEQIMMIYYNKPCRRVAPGSREVRKYGRGSVLVMKDEVLLVLCPEDNTTDWPKSHMRIVGSPVKCYKGLLPGSRFYTSAGTYVMMEDEDATGELRCFFFMINRMLKYRRERGAPRDTRDLTEGELTTGSPNTVAKIAWRTGDIAKRGNGNPLKYRCREAASLTGFKAGRRVRRAAREEAATVWGGG